jgi:equilibrative nucleoside transporter 1/2/3
MVKFILHLTCRSGKYGESTLLYFQIAYSFPNILGLLAIVKFADRIPLLIKAIPTYVLCFLILISVPIMGFANVTPNVGFPITLSMLVVLALSGSLLQGGVFGLAGIFPPNYMQAVMMGNGFAGLTVSLIRILTKATIEAEGSTDKTILISSSIYFFVSAGVIILCIISYLILLRSPFVRYYLKKSTQPAANDIVQYDDYNNIQAEPQTVSVWQVFKKIWLMAFGVFMVFTVTLAIFPGLVVTIPTMFPTSKWAEWFPVILVFFFQLFDTVGRTLPRWIIAFNQRTVIVPILLRVVFLILFLLCLKPRLILHDAFPLIFMALMAFTNGYLSSLVMMFAPSNVKEHEKQTAGTMMTFFLLLGICAGSNIGLGIGLLRQNS